LPYAWLSGQVGVWTLSGELWTRERIGNVALLSAQGDTSIQTAEVEHTLQASIGALTLDAGLSSRFFDRFATRFGLTVALLLRRQYHQYEQLVAPAGFVFAAEGSRRRNEYSGVIPGSPVALLGTSFSIGYTLPIGRRWELVPTLHYTVFLTNLSSVNWKVSALRVGLTLVYTIFPPPVPFRDTVYQRDTVTLAVPGIVQEELQLVSRRTVTDTLRAAERPWYRTTISEVWHRRVPRPTRLEATLSLVLPDTTTLVVEELEQEEVFPLLPYVFFPDGSARLEQTRMRLLSPSDAARFDENRLPMNTLQVYYELLNIVGKRLRQFPKAELTITGCVSNVGVEAGNQQLARRRAEAVRDYLVNVWGIEPQRLHIRARLLPESPSNPETPDGQEENRRVELTATAPEILAPVFLAEVGYVVTPSMLHVRTAVEAETTLAQWKLVVRASDTLAVRSGAGVPPSSLAVELVPEVLARGDSLVHALLTVRDITGTEQRAVATLPFRRLSLRQKRAERIGNERRERFALMLFEYDKANLTPEHRRLIPLIRQRIQPGTQVIISGYTDRTGDPAYNKRLAEQRCRAVWQALNIRGVQPTIRAIGSDILLYPNELPEGRAYSRTVHVELLTPVE